MLLTVLLGGTSSERNVSLASGLRMAAALREGGHTVRLLDPATGPIDAATEATWRERSVGAAPPTPEELAGLKLNDQTPTLPVHPLIRDAECVVLALHGGQGEDGTVQALLDVAGVRYTGSGAMASAIALDKDMTKRLLVHAGVPTAAWRMTPVDADTAIGRTGAAADREAEPGREHGGADDREGARPVRRGGGRGPPLRSRGDVRDVRAGPRVDGAGAGGRGAAGGRDHPGEGDL